MNLEILAPGIQDYIHSHLNDDVNKIALAKSPFEGVSSGELANQIVSKKKAEKKLPTWFKTDKIYYPPALSIEQTSSEKTAEYKSNLAIGPQLIDLTGGFGVDSYFFSKKVEHIIHCEWNQDLSEMARYNAKMLGANNITFFAGDGLSFIEKQDAVNTLYLDPARRSEKGKVFMLKDCVPDVVGHLDLLLKRSERIVMKTAPLLDLSMGLSELRSVSQIHIVSVKNECKELLWVIDQNPVEDTAVIAATLNNSLKTFEFKLSEASVAAHFCHILAVDDYLYEPDVALLKSGAFNLIGNRYNLLKLHAQTQLYTSKKVQENFPGRIFRILEVLSSSELKRRKELKGNVIVRNYPARAEELVKKYAIKSDQHQYLIFTKDFSDRLLIIKGEILQHY